MTVFPNLLSFSAAATSEGRGWGGGTERYSEGGNEEAKVRERHEYGDTVWFSATVSTSICCSH